MDKMKLMKLSEIGELIEGVMLQLDYCREVVQNADCELYEDDVDMEMIHRELAVVTYALIHLHRVLDLGFKMNMECVSRVDLGKALMDYRALRREGKT